MSYQVLARKWRPSTFSQLVGQEHVVNAIVNGLTQQRLHHAYLFAGTRGVGKTTIARIFAKSLNCEQGTSAEPCGVCDTCRDIDQGRYVDLLEIDAASRTKVEDTREILDNVQYKPTRGKYKVYLIDEVHMLSKHSFNALLKTLEEPPSHVKFLLATTDPQKLPVTILSRCLQFNLKALSKEQIEQQLAYVLGKENIAYDTSAINYLARSARGSMRDALSLTDQAIAQGNGKVEQTSVVDMLGLMDANQLVPLLMAILNAEHKKAFELFEKMAEKAPDYERLLSELLSVLHQIALTQYVPQACKVDTNVAKALYTLAQKLPPEQVQLQYQIALQGRKDLPFASEPKSGFEMTMLRMMSFNPEREMVAHTEITQLIASEPVPKSSENPSVAVDTPANQAVSETAQVEAETHLPLDNSGAYVETNQSVSRAAETKPLPASHDVGVSDVSADIDYSEQQEHAMHEQLMYEQQMVEMQAEDARGPVSQPQQAPLQQSESVATTDDTDALLALHTELAQTTSVEPVKKNISDASVTKQDNPIAELSFTRESISAETPPWLEQSSDTKSPINIKKTASEVIEQAPKVTFDAAQPIAADVTIDVPVFDDVGTKIVKAAQLDSWSELIESLNLMGLVKQLALCSSYSKNGELVVLEVLPEKQDLCTVSAQHTIQQALSEHFGIHITLEIALSKATNAPVAIQQEIGTSRQQHAESVIEHDPSLQQLQRTFGTVLIKDSIKPR